MCDVPQVRVLYTAPTLIRSLMQHGDHFVTQHDRSSLRILGTVGEPINPHAWDWYHQVRLWGATSGFVEAGVVGHWGIALCEAEWDVAFYVGGLRVGGRQGVGGRVDQVQQVKQEVVGCSLVVCKYSKGRAPMDSP